MGNIEAESLFWSLNHGKKFNQVPTSKKTNYGPYKINFDSQLKTSVLFKPNKKSLSFSTLPDNTLPHK